MAMQHTEEELEELGNEARASALANDTRDAQNHVTGAHARHATPARDTKSYQPRHSKQAVAALIEQRRASSDTTTPMPPVMPASYDTAEDTEPGTEAPDTPSETDAAPPDETAARTQVAKSSAMMSMATLLSRLTGFVRTWAMAFALGNTVFTSAYQVANTLPNTLYELVAGGIIATAFMPVLMSQKTEGGEKRSHAYANNLLSLCIVALAALSILFTFLSPQIVASQTFVNADAEEVDLAIWFFRFFAIQIMFYGIGAIMSGMLNSQRKFLMPSLASVFNNIVVIITFFGFVPISHIDIEAAKIWLAVGTSLGVAAQCLIQIPALRKTRFRFHFHIDLHDPALRETAKLAVPAIIVSVINLVVVSIRNAFSLGVAANGPSTLAYAWIWFQFPYGVLAVALSTAMFTEMSESVADHDDVRFKQNLKDGLQGTFFLIIPMAFMLLTCASLLVTLYHAGQFTAEDIDTVTQVLMWWAITLPLYAGFRFLHFSFSARRELMYVAKVSIVTSTIEVALYALLTTGAGDWGGLGLIGIPIADGIFLVLSFFWLVIQMHRRIGAFGGRSILKVVFKTTVASIAGGAVAILAQLLLGDTTSILKALVEIVVAGGAGLAVTFGLCALMKVEEMELVKKLFRRIGGRFSRQRS